MSEVFDFVAGDLPLLISVPHDGRDLPSKIRDRMTPAGQAIPDTDWDVARLYEFVEDMGACMLVAKNSRYVVDLNRSADDEVLYPGQLVTGLCPEHTFGGDAIYRSGVVSEGEQRGRVETYWRPYHEKLQQTLDAMCTTHGVALLWDAHSIPSKVPRLFDGELPVLNIGSNSGKSCGADIESAVAAVATASDYNAVLNGRFKGGFITRNYGKPSKGVHALQLEIAQRAYWNEGLGRFDDASAEPLRDTLKNMLIAFLDAAKK
ncbi:MAG: N-formylglutamate deformylase [Gammaproteobacteria bacterium]|nr:N-formylglutamate deformylase [Gammaproteobacteria bacterium]